MTIETISEHRCFGGTVGFYRHRSRRTRTDMRFAVYVPPQSANGHLPMLTYLAGLTCTEETFIVKAGALRLAAEHGLLLLAPDTSPRGAGLPGEDDDWDFGTGAGFYVTATAEPWSRHYDMYGYVTDELPALVADGFPADPGRQGIFGHSMGGHGALVAALKNPGRYRSVSAFAPIAAPMDCPWGEKAFSGYLGRDRGAWAEWDASRLIATASERLPLLVDQGTADQFLDSQLNPERLEAACHAVNHPLTLRRQDGYDHSYYFIQSFIADHMAFHAAALGA